jgi:hypothetical protein
VYVVADVSAQDGNNLEVSVTATPSRHIVHASNDGLVKQLDGNVASCLILKSSIPMANLHECGLIVI